MSNSDCGSHSGMPLRELTASSCQFKDHCAFLSKVTLSRLSTVKVLELGYFCLTKCRFNRQSLLWSLASLCSELHCNPRTFLAKPPLPSKVSDLRCKLNVLPADPDSFCTLSFTSMSPIKSLALLVSVSQRTLTDVTNSVQPTEEKHVIRERHREMLSTIFPTSPNHYLHGKQKGVILYKAPNLRKYMYIIIHNTYNLEKR